MYSTTTSLAYVSVSQTSSTVLLTLIYLNAVSKLYSSREHIVTNFVSAPWAAFVNGAIQIFLLLLLLLLLYVAYLLCINGMLHVAPQHIHTICFNCCVNCVA